MTGSYVGGNNSFDEGRASDEKFCTWEQIFELAKMGCKIGWHSWTHQDLTKLTPEEIEAEVKPPFPIDSFAYPYGKFNDQVIEIVKKYFKNAYSVTEGDNSEYQLLRQYV